MQFRCISKTLQKNLSRYIFNMNISMPAQVVFWQSIGELHLFILMTYAIRRRISFNNVNRAVKGTSQVSAATLLEGNQSNDSRKL